MAAVRLLTSHHVRWWYNASSLGDSLSYHWCHTALTPIYKHGMGRGERWVVVSQLQQQCTLMC